MRTAKNGKRDTEKRNRASLRIVVGATKRAVHICVQMKK